MTAPVRIALLGCGAEYSGVMPEIYEPVLDELATMNIACKEAAEEY